jgi:hypothetical protein
MPKMENSIDLGLRENLQTEPEFDFMNNMGAEPLGFITNQAEGGIMPRNSEFMATGCFESNCIFSMAHPRM